MGRKKQTQDINPEDIVRGLEGIIRSEEKKFGQPNWFLHSGNLALDYIVSQLVDGSGGYPGGTICEIYGEPSSGKTIIMARAAAEMQKLDNIVVVFDAEGRWNFDFLEQQGVDTDKLIVGIPETIEDFTVDSVKILNRLEELGQKALLVLDSLAILSTIKEIEDVEGGDMKADQGRKAQRIKASMRVIRSKLWKTDSILFVANHTISNPGVYGNSKITPGGGGTPYQASIRLELGKPTPLTITGKERPIGTELHIKITKNSIAPPFGECDIQLFWSSSINKYSGLLSIAIDLGIIEKKGAWNYYKETAFQSGDFGNIIAKFPEILEDRLWKHNYFIGE